MAKAAKSPLRVRSSNPSDASDEVEVDDTAQIETAEEVSAAEVAETDASELVKVSVFQTITPAPTVGNVSLTRDHGMETLNKGVHSLPKCVAEVLVDRGIAAYV